MLHAIEHGPSFTSIEFTCGVGESVVAQPGAMLAMTTGFDLSARAGAQMRGGSGLRRAFGSLAAGESFFAAIYTARRDGEKLMLAPDQAGDIRAIEIGEDRRYLIAPGAFLACTPGVELAAVYAGMRGFLATRGLFLMRTEGQGSLFLCSHGAFVERQLAEGERYVLDNQYIVAFSHSLHYETVKVAGSLRHSLLSGEGLVNRYTGPGMLLFQTRTRPRGGFWRNLLNLST